MRSTIIPFLLTSVLMLSFTARTEWAEEPAWLTEIGQKVPTFRFQTKSGPAQSIEDYRGKVVLLNFFATWCPPCRQELPRVQAELWDTHGDNPEFEILVLAREEGWDKLDPFIEKTGYTFPIVPDLDRTVFAKFALQSIPRNVIIDREGKIIYQSIGYSAAEFDNMVALIERELAGE